MYDVYSWPREVTEAEKSPFTELGEWGAGDTSSLWQASTSRLPSEHCQREWQASEERRGARNSQSLQANKVLERSKRKAVEISVGDNVRVAAPKFDYARGMYRNIIGVERELRDWHRFQAHTDRFNVVMRW